VKDRPRRAQLPRSQQLHGTVALGCGLDCESAGRRLGAVRGLRRTFGSRHDHATRRRPESPFAGESQSSSGRSALGTLGGALFCRPPTRMSGLGQRVTGRRSSMHTARAEPIRSLDQRANRGAVSGLCQMPVETPVEDSGVSTHKEAATTAPSILTSGIAMNWLRDLAAHPIDPGNF
jgi:hypothetical protein